MTEAFEKWMKEGREFRPVVGFPGYFISNDGIVVSCVRGSYKERSARVGNGRYWYIGLHKDKKKHTKQVHRLVMEAFVGPSELDVDHINNNGFDNRLENLRYCTTRQNATFSNRKDYDIKTSRFPGVCWSKAMGKWQSQIRINGRRKYLGLFDSEIEAYNTYQKQLQDGK